MYNFDQPFNRRNTNCWKWDGEGKGLTLAMGCADTDFRMPEAISNALINKINEGALTYPVTNIDTRNALSHYFLRHYSTVIDADWICDSVGMMNGFRLLMEALTNKDDEIIIQSPVFNYFNDTIENAGRIVIDNHLNLDKISDEYVINFEHLEVCAAREKAKIMLICNPANPTGKIYTKEELMKISEICLRHNVIVISDEIHADFYFNGYQHTSIMNLDTVYTNNSIIMTGPGKTFNIHGLYASFHIIPNEIYRNAYKKEYSIRHMDCLDLSMIASKVAYDECDEYVFELKNYISNNLSYVKKYLAENDIQIKMHKFNATYLLWLDFNEWKLKSVDIDKLLRAKGLSLTIGSQFGYQTEGYMRMDIATQLTNVKKALEIMRDVYKQL